NHVTCSTNKKSVTWSYYCSSANNGQGEIRTKVIANSDCSDNGGGGGGACAPTDCCQGQFAECCTFDYSMCSCNCSPILIDILGNGFSLTDANNGVNFDLNADGVAGRIGWTMDGADEALLVLDRNGNDIVDNGAELFGSSTPQPPTDHPNGFIALAEYDKP